MNFRRTLTGLALAGTLALTSAGCFYHQVYETGEVVEESFKDTAYVLNVKTDKGNYKMTVYEQGMLFLPSHNLVGRLAESIEIGDSVKFPLKASVSLGENQLPFFNEQRVGSVPAEYVTVLKK